MKEIVHSTFCPSFNIPNFINLGNLLVDILQYADCERWTYTHTNGMTTASSIYLCLSAGNNKEIIMETRA